MSSEKVRIAIVGGGISGLAFAIALAKSDANVDVDIYESTATFGQVGAGIGFFPRILEDLRFLGFADDLEKKGLGGENLLFMSGDEARNRVWGESNAPLWALHRAEFLDVLLKHLPSHYRAHFGKRLVTFSDTSSGPVSLTFQDTSTAVCDVLVGADGIKSATRQAMYEQLAVAELDSGKADALRNHKKPKWTGRYVYRSTVSRDELEKRCHDHPALSRPVFLSGKQKYILSYPIAQGRMFNVSVMVLHSNKEDTIHDEPWDLAIPQSDLKQLFAGWSPYVQNLIDCMAKPAGWVLNSTPGLPTYVSGRVAFIGDAAHAMTPHLASGAAQGIEDGLLLATLFAQPNTSIATIPAVLKVYDEIRRPFSQNVIRKSAEVGRLMLLDSEPARGYSAEASMAGQIPDEVLKKVADGVADQMNWTWTTSAKDDRERAVEMLRSVLQEGDI